MFAVTPIRGSGATRRRSRGLESEASARRLSWDRARSEDYPTRLHSLESEEHSESLAYVSDGFRCRLGFKHNSARLPVEVLDVVREDHAGDLAARRQRHLEWIALYVSRDGAGNRQPCLRVVDARREDERRTASALLVAGLRITRQPHQIAGVWNVRASYHASWPTGVPQSLSSWRLRGVILATSCSRE